MIRQGCLGCFGLLLVIIVLLIGLYMTGVIYFKDSNQDNKQDSINIENIDNGKSLEENIISD